ncbi:MAG: M56 family metallopeptidase, partial [Bacteroidaceae bacterium]|nr:M56 family metallopeptidase [Bacteroidaceae bacterium]
MTAILTYILKWSLGLAVLYLPFALLLRKETFATLNRRLLLCIIIASALLPCITVSYPVEIELPSQSHATATVNDTVTSYSAKPIATTASIKGIITSRNIFILYSVGVIVSALLFTTSLIRAMRRLRRGAIWVDRQKRMTVYCHTGNTAPFSLFHNVVISQSDYDECGKEILLHEEGHIRHGHSYDMLLISIVKSLQWFNPFIYLLANDIKEIHEYEADRYVLQHNGNTQAYQMLILKKAVGNIPFPLANNFSQSCVRKRIKMMSRKESSGGKRCKWLYLLPVSAAYIGAFAQPEYIYITAPKAAEPNTTQQQQPTKSEETALQPTRCMPASGKATIAYSNTAPKRLPKEIARIELPAFEEELLITDSYCEYIDLENSIAAEPLRASGIRKCDIKVN